MKKLLICLGIFLLAIILCPLGFVLLSQIGAWEGIGFIFILNLLLYPIAFVGMGIVAGTDIKKLWFVPVAASILYLPAMWLVLRSFVIEFTVYAVIYLIIAVVAMLITHSVIRMIRKGASHEEKF